MGTSMFTAVTGLLANQRKLDAISANISNSNTTGYRSSRVLFQDLLSQTLAGGRASVARFGSTNPQQIGLGVRIGSIDVDFGQGSLYTTGAPSDLAIQGDGFFVLNNGDLDLYTRDGSFSVDAEGRLIDPATGFIVQGFLADSEGNIDPTESIQDITIPVGERSLVQPTSIVRLGGNFESNTPPGETVVRTLDVFDTLGTQREITITFEKTPNTNEWNWTATDDDPNTTVTGSGTIAFNTNGDVDSVSSSQVSVEFDGDQPAEPTDPFEFELAFGGLTQLNDTSDVTILSQDGVPRGTLDVFNITQDGMINGVFTNGMTLTLGQIATATFSNSGGLERVGDNMFRRSPASGNAQVGVPNTGGRGSVSGGVLERSNVDLGSEFSNLIITQRAFQANARMVTTSDTLLQETVNLIR